MEIESLFTQLRARAGPRDEHASRVVAVLSAVQATLRGGPPEASSSSTAYFAALMTALERGGLTHATEIFFLLAMLLPHVPRPVVQAKSELVVAAFAASLSSAAVAKDAAVLKPLLACIGHVLSALGDAEDSWAPPSVPRLFSALIAFAGDERPKVRKVAQGAVLEVLSVSRRLGGSGGAASATAAASFGDALRGASQREQTRLLQLTSFLREALPLLAPNVLTGICEELLRLPSLGLPRLTGAVYECVAALLESDRARVSVAFVRRLAAALLVGGPSLDDAASAVHFVYALAACLTRLASMERLRAGKSIGVVFAPRAVTEVAAAASTAPAATCPVALALLPASAAVLVSYCASDRPEVYHAAANSLAIVLVALIDAGAIAQAMALTYARPGVPLDLAVSATPAAPAVVQVVARVAELTQLRFHDSWAASLPLFAVIWGLFGTPASFSVAGGLLRALLELRGALSAAGGDDLTAAKGGWEDEDDGDKRRVFQPKKLRVRLSADQEPGSSDDDDAAYSGSERGCRRSAPSSSGALPSLQGLARTLDGVMSAGIRAMGVELFTRIIPFAGTPEVPLCGVAEDRLWLLPLLAAHGSHVPARIGWFTSAVLPAIRVCDEAAAAAQAGGFSRNARVLVARSTQLWRLLPVVLRAPTDVANGAFDATLGRALSAVLANASRPDLAEVVSRGLVALIGGLRAAAGLPTVSVDQYRRLSGDAEDDDVVGAGSRSVVGGGGVGRDDATVFGAGGISVYGGSVSLADPRHQWLAQAMKAPPLGLPATAASAGDDESGAASDTPCAAAAKASATAGLAAVSALARNYLPVLFNTFEVAVVAASQPITQPAAAAPGAAAAPSPPVTGAALLSRVQHVLEATTLYLSVAPQDLVRSLAGKLVSMLGAGLKALVAAQQNADAEKVAAKKSASRDGSSGTGAAARAAVSSAARCSALLSLATALLPSLSTSAAAATSVDGLAVLEQIFSIVRPVLGDERHSALQKRAYSVLASLLYHHPAFIGAPPAPGSLPVSQTRLDDLISLLQQSLVSVSAAARRGRLLCLRHVVASLAPDDPSHVAVLPSVLGEVMLCCRDSNAKVRAAAEAVLGAMAEWMAAGGDGPGLGDDDAGTEEVSAPVVAARVANLTEMFRMVVGGLGASTPHMRAASVSALALLLYNYADRAVVRGMLPALADAVLLLAKEKSREVAGSVIGFCRVLASVVPPRELAPLVNAIVTAIMVWGGETKNHLRVKIKGVLRRLSRRVGLDAVAAHLPAADSPLVEYMRKMQERKARRREDASARASGGGEGFDEGDAGGAHSRAGETRTAFGRLMGDDNATEASGDSFSDDEMSDLLPRSRSGATEGEMARSVAKSWGVVGSRAGAGSISAPPSIRLAGKGRTSVATGIGARSSFMSAVTSMQRARSDMLSGAPLPPPGAVLADAAEFLDAHQRRRAAAAKSVASERRGGSAPGTVASEAGTSRLRRAAGGGGGAAGRGDVASAVLRADDDAPLDLLDAALTRSLVEGDDPLKVLARDRMRRRLAEADDASKMRAAGITIAKDGRFVIPPEDTSGGSGVTMGGGGAAAATAAAAEKRRGREGDEDADDDDVDVDVVRGQAAALRELLPRTSAARLGRDKRGRRVLPQGATAAAAEEQEGDGADGPAATGVRGGGGRTWGARGAQHSETPGGRGRRGAAAGTADRFSGAQYRSTSSKPGSAGDTQRPGARFEPFAYVPLDPRSISGAAGHKSVGRFDAVSASTSRAGRAARKQQQRGDSVGGSLRDAPGRSALGKRRR